MTLRGCEQVKIRETLKAGPTKLPLRIVASANMSACHIIYLCVPKLALNQADGSFVEVLKNIRFRGRRPQNLPQAENLSVRRLAQISMTYISILVRVHPGFSCQDI